MVSMSFYYFVIILPLPICFFFFFNDTATTEIYTLSLHDALPICRHTWQGSAPLPHQDSVQGRKGRWNVRQRSEEHTSELQSLAYLVCRLLLEKKKNKLEKCHNM